MSTRRSGLHGNRLRVIIALGAVVAVVALVLTFGDGVETSQAGQASSGGTANNSNPAGGLPYDEDLKEKIRTAWENRDPAYKPRTQHLNPDGSPKFTNRLFLETNPYLLQHAHNPTNWYPWGYEAFEAAKQLGRPVLLSVGYSTCHWCHVMEEESFDDLEIARYLNENYIAIKVDREERPDIDAIYMSAVQAMTGRGGWPMTVWLTPDRKPFYGGTYFPARDGDRGVRMGFLTLLGRLAELYESDPASITQRADQLTQAINQMLTPPAGTGLPDAAVLHEAMKYYQSRFDKRNGGPQGAPKFPSSLPVRFLLRYHRHTGDPESLEMAAVTLRKMAQGGIYDHVGGGFHRYSTDERWLVPHFEKMLYDNALLTIAYLEGHQVTGEEDFARVAREILRYVERDMMSPNGAFYSATDADSLNPDGHREEGWFFTWTPAEIDELLSDKEAKAVHAHYAVTAGGNFEGRNILHTPKPLAEVAKQLSLPLDELRSLIERSKRQLYEARGKRPRPLRDEKILTAWNGLMISAFSHAALVLGDQHYADIAEGAAEFVLTRLLDEGRLFRSYKDGEAKHNAYLDDYAFFIAALLDLYEATSRPRWLQQAVELDQVLAKHYEDQRNGGFFMTSDDHEKLLAREKPSYDGAEPSGNSVAALNLLRLHEFTTDDAYRQRAVRALKAFQEVLTTSPAALSEMLLAVDYHLDTPKEIIIVTPESRREAEPLLSQLRHAFVPNRVVAVVPETDQALHQALIPLIENKTAQKGRPTAYVCERQVCELPTSDPQVFARQIAKIDRLSNSTR